MVLSALPSGYIVRSRNFSTSNFSRKQLSRFGQGRWVFDCTHFAYVQLNSSLLLSFLCGPSSHPPWIKTHFRFSFFSFSRWETRDVMWNVHWNFLKVGFLLGESPQWNYSRKTTNREVLETNTLKKSFESWAFDDEKQAKQFIQLICQKHKNWYVTTPKSFPYTSFQCFSSINITQRLLSQRQRRRRRRREQASNNNKSKLYTFRQRL